MPSAPITASPSTRSPPARVTPRSSTPLTVDAVAHRRPLGEHGLQGGPLDHQHRRPLPAPQRLDVDLRQRAAAGVTEHRAPGGRGDGAHRPPLPSASSAWTAFGHSTSPAPIAAPDGERSSTIGPWPARATARAAHRPPIPAPTTTIRGMTPEHSHRIPSSGRGPVSRSDRFQVEDGPGRVEERLDRRRHVVVTPRQARLELVGRLAEGDGDHALPAAHRPRIAARWRRRGRRLGAAGPSRWNDSLRSFGSKPACRQMPTRRRRAEEPARGGRARTRRPRATPARSTSSSARVCGGRIATTARCGSTRRRYRVRFRTPGDRHVDRARAKGGFHVRVPHLLRDQLNVWIPAAEAWPSAGSVSKRALQLKATFS